MKKVLGLIVIFQMFFLCLLGQTAMPAVDKSPMDMSYYPTNYPVLKIQDKISDAPIARVIYSRPQKSGRPIFGGLIKSTEVWRMGANEATEIEFFKNVRVGGKKVSKGRYTLYALVSEKSWTIIVNKATDTWGAFAYDQKKDVVRTEVPTQKSDGLVESLSMVFEKTSTGFNLVIAWENTKVSIPFTL